MDSNWKANSAEPHHAMFTSFIHKSDQNMLKNKFKVSFGKISNVRFYHENVLFSNLHFEMGTLWIFYKGSKVLTIITQLKVLSDTQLSVGILNHLN